MPVGTTLFKFDDRTITFDTNANPLSYYNGTRWNFTWENGRSLATATDGTTNISYAYDAAGLRTAKTVGSVTHKYLYASGQLLRESYGNNISATLSPWQYAALPHRKFVTWKPVADPPLTFAKLPAPVPVQERCLYFHHIPSARMHLLKEPDETQSKGPAFPPENVP